MYKIPSRVNELNKPLEELEEILNKQIKSVVLAEVDEMM